MVAHSSSSPGSIRLDSKALFQRVDRSFVIAMGVALITLLWTGFHLSTYLVNFPFIDDYQTIVDFLNHTQTDLPARLVSYTVWRPHNEHRIVFTRLAAMTYAYLLPGGVRFDVLSASGLLFRGLILWCLYQQWSRIPVKTSMTKYESVAGFLVVVFIITNGRDLENLLSATCALQNIPVVAWALLSFGAASRNRWTAAWLLGALATLTSANGIFVLLLLSSERLINRRWLMGGTAMAVSIVIYMLYRSGMPLNVAVNSRQLATLVPKFFAFQGSFFYLHYYLQEYAVAYTLPTVFVGLLYTAVGLETLWRYRNGQLSLFYPAVFAFVWLTALPVALFRFGVLEGRFATYSIVLTAVVYARLTDYVRAYRPGYLRLIHPLGLLGAFLLFAQSYIVHDRTAQRQYRTSLADYYTLWHNTSTIYDQPRQKLEQLRRAGLFSTGPVDRMAKQVFNASPPPSGPAQAPVARLGTYGNYHLVRTSVACTFLLLKQGQNQIALPTDSHEDVPASTTFFMPSWFPVGAYTVAIVNNEGVWPTHLSIHN